MATETHDSKLHSTIPTMELPLEPTPPSPQVTTPIAPSPTPPDQAQSIPTAKPDDPPE